ncbi:MAG: glutaredoxin family protein [Polyangia bacterium]
MMRHAPVTALLATALAASAVLAACGDDSAGSAGEPQAGSYPLVTDDRDDLVFTWYADGGPQVASSVAGVPKRVRPEVRVQDPAIPPDERDPRWIFLADLTGRGKDERYPVRAELRSEWEKRRSGAAETTEKEPTPSSKKTRARDGSPLVMYSTAHCPVCKRARRWLLDEGIAYREKDVEKDPQAARELKRRAAEQGVSATGVPVFEIGGRLLPGFDREAIRAALSEKRETREQTEKSSVNSPLE